MGSSGTKKKHFLNTGIQVSEQNRIAHSVVSYFFRTSDNLLNDPINTSGCTKGNVLKKKKKIVNYHTLPDNETERMLSSKNKVWGLNRSNSSLNRS